MATENVSGWTALESRHAYSIEDIAVEDLGDDWEGLVSDETDGEPDDGGKAWIESSDVQISRDLSGGEERLRGVDQLREAVEQLSEGILRANGDLELEADAGQICGGGSRLPAHASHSSGDTVQSLSIEVLLSASGVPHDADDLPLSANCLQLSASDLEVDADGVPIYSGSGQCYREQQHTKRYRSGVYEVVGIRLIFAGFYDIISPQSTFVDISSHGCSWASGAN
ncbi:hypothetical protein PI124_g19448 [Phytophthora idaei]|nr:hypothetical protein PI125_g22765 [Phytophthora idaei]KAG3130110.1 hypothetical protein PI126_g20650 [Phytophthora idaei]KAG3235516.1 hypothetical protein PI124_g19448 [Phytophthora idaei]